MVIPMSNPNEVAADSGQPYLDGFRPTIKCQLKFQTFSAVLLLLLILLLSDFVDKLVYLFWALLVIFLLVLSSYPID